MDVNARKPSFAAAALSALIVLNGALITPVHAQLNEQVAACDELKDSFFQRQAQACSAHVGCNLILKLQRECTKAREFLTKLNDSLAGRREISNNDVFEANSPAITLPALRLHVETVRQLVLDSANDPAKGSTAYRRFEGGYLFYYEGVLKDGVPHGIGVHISESGDTSRGQYANGSMHGQAQSIAAWGGAVVSGSWVGGKVSGYVIVGLPDGSGMAGISEMGKPIGIWEHTKPTGFTQKFFHAADGTVAMGPEAPLGEIARAPGESPGPGASAGPAGSSAPGQGGSSAPGSPDYQPSRPSPSPTSGSAAAKPRAIVASRSCEDVLNSLFDPANDVAASARLTPAQNAQSSVWVMQVYMRVANTHPACANDPQSRRKVASALRTEQDRCRAAGSANCEAGQNYLGTAARTEAAIRQLFQESSAAEGPTANAQSVSGACIAAIDRQEAEFRPISQRIANTQSVVHQSQLLMGMLSKRMALLDQLCKGQPLYATYAGTKQQFDSSMRACRGVATEPADCVPQ